MCALLISVDVKLSLEQRSLEKSSKGRKHLRLLATLFCRCIFVGSNADTIQTHLHTVTTITSETSSYDFPDFLTHMTQKSFFYYYYFLFEKLRGAFVGLLLIVVFSFVTWSRWNLRSGTAGLTVSFNTFWRRKSCIYFTKPLEWICNPWSTSLCVYFLLIKTMNLDFLDVFAGFTLLERFYEIQAWTRLVEFCCPQKWG